jgi:hypothetical protein
VVFKVLISEAKPYKKTLNTETAVEEKVVPKNQKKKAAKRREKDSAIINAARTSNLYNMASGYGAAGVSSDDDDFDEAEYRAYREELAAYDDFVASLDMDD